MKRISRIFIVFMAMNLILLPFVAGSSLQISLASKDEKKTLISFVMRKILREKDIEAALERYRFLKENEPDKYDFSENTLNGLGYNLLQQKQVKDAIEIFKLNVEAFPQSANPYDSLAEGYLNDGDLENAVIFYKKALEKDPDFPDPITGLDRIYIMENYEKRKHLIPMRDGIKLFTQVYSPKDKSRKYPILLFRTPYSVRPYGEEKLKYRNMLGPHMIFSKEGFIFARQDVRGKYMSEGEYVDMRPHKSIKKGPSDIDESSDSYDTIDWLVKSVSNNNGKVGIWGVSYPGFYSSMALIDSHPALVAASPQAPIADWFIDDDFHRNGAFYLLQAVNFMRSWGSRPEPTVNRTQMLLKYPKPNLYDFLLELGPIANINERYFKGKVGFWNQMMEHGTYDDFWQARNILPHLKNIKAAVLMVGGWFDAEDLYGPLKTYFNIEKNNPGIQNHLVMGPWYHGGWRGQGSEKLGDILVYAASAGKYFQENILLPFFKYYLKGKGELNLSEAFVYETGSNVWQLYEAWPPENIERKGLYLHPDKMLSFEEPTNTEKGTFDEYLSDPGKPVPHLGNTIHRWSYDFMHADQRYAATRPDVLVYESDVLKQNVTISGSIKAVLHVSTTGTDADWVVKLIDVYSDNMSDPTPNPRGVRMGGYQMLVRGEIMRGKFRNSFERPEPFSPGKVTKVELELQDINHTFLNRHKIMIQIQSTWFPLFDRNPQKFVDIYGASEKDFQKAFHRVYHSKEYPSHLKVNVAISKKEKQTVF